MKKEHFVSDTTQDYYSYQLENSKIKLRVSDLGGTILNLWVKSPNEKWLDVVLGYEDPKAYLQNTDTYFGGVVGRNCNRTENATFSLKGRKYNLSKNENNNNLHSGPDGFQIRLWKVTSFLEDRITFSLDSPAGDQGFPGELKVSVTYQLLADGIQIFYEGLSNEETIFNFTNHSYFNLNGHQSGDVLQHQLQLLADFYTPVKDAASIPSGEILSVEGTPFDFRESKSIGKDLFSNHVQLQYTGGYDHNFVLRQEEEQPFVVAKGDHSNITMKAYTNLPGVQFYSGNFLKNEAGKEGTIYRQHNGLCLETQFFPNAINTPSFTSPILPKDIKKSFWTSYRFE